MSIGIGDLSRTSAEPSTEVWVWVIGNRNFSNAGRSSAFALIPPSTTTVAPMIENSLLIHTSVQSLRRLSSKARDEFGYAAPGTLNMSIIICQSSSKFDLISLSCVGGSISLVRPFWLLNIDVDYHLSGETVTEKTERKKDETAFEIERCAHHGAERAGLRRDADAGVSR